MLTVSSLGGRFQKCCRDFPSLINTVSVILLPHWDKEALVAHAYHLLKGNFKKLLSNSSVIYDRKTGFHKREEHVELPWNVCERLPWLSLITVHFRRYMKHSTQCLSGRKPSTFRCRRIESIEWSFDRYRLVVWQSSNGLLIVYLNEWTSLICLWRWPPLHNACLNGN